MLGPLERYMTLTFETALLCSSRAGSDLGRTSERFKELIAIYHIQGTCMPTSLYLTAHQPAKRARLLDLASSHAGLA